LKLLKAAVTTGALSALLCLLPSHAQEISFGEQPKVGKQHLVLLSDEVDVQAGKPQIVELRFRVDPGFHINSHTPHDETLIPTVLHLEPADGVRVGDATYPAGTSFHLPIGAGETLDVYQGEFRVTMKLTAQRGAWTLAGGLRYQACDNAACFPPRMLPVRIAVNAQ
jgi:DsbC/DsbD-like thiol-disulfide interchange protein